MCEELVDGTSILKSNPMVDCWVGWHLLLVVESAALILLYILAIPVGFAVLLTRGRRLDKLKDPEWLEKYGSLYTRYENDWYAPALPNACAGRCQLYFMPEPVYANTIQCLSWYVPTLLQARAGVHDYYLRPQLM